MKREDLPDVEYVSSVIFHQKDDGTVSTQVDGDGTAFFANLEFLDFMIETYNNLKKEINRLEALIVE